jgi:hypothetical protein
MFYIVDTSFHTCVFLDTQVIKQTAFPSVWGGGGGGEKERKLKRLDVGFF